MYVVRTYLIYNLLSWLARDECSIILVNEFAFDVSEIW